MTDDTIRLRLAEWAMMLTALHGAGYRVEFSESKLPSGVLILIAKASERRAEAE